ncbi:MAG: cytochrome c3 family protein [Bacteroidetes bacterium]|nr:cytochrome c3 family protein [Bacteroidota bacterium]
MTDTTVHCRYLSKRTILVLFLLFFALALWLSQGRSTAFAADPQPSPNDACLSCHKQPTLAITLKSGEKMSLTVDEAAFNASVHGNKVPCTACHSEIASVPHAKLEVNDRREYQLQRYEACKNCHFPEYTKTLDSTHYQQLIGGNRQAPVCTDCHGSHNIGPPDVPRAQISKTCAQCHKDINDQYVKSVHGKALVNGNGNEDVPVCTTCHGVHKMEDPRTARFRLESPELCAGCHANAGMMNKYGISTDVFQTYLKDFHGVTVGFYEKQDLNIWSYEAVCTDCHGVHDMRKVDDPESSVIKANLVKTCQKCHPNATTNFPTAWMMHYEPSPTKFPIVFFVRTFYWIVIPLMVAGVSAHVLLDLWRALANRRRMGGIRQ